MSACSCEQKEMHLDEALVLQQLHYTGMLETVRIRRSGYGAKYHFQVPPFYCTAMKAMIKAHVKHTYFSDINNLLNFPVLISSS